MKPRFSWLVIPLIVICCFWAEAPGWAFAADIRQGPTALVAPGETVDDDVFGGGQSVTISGHVLGDVYAGAQTVVVNGSIDGDLIAAAEQVIVDGSVGGNVRAAGATITVNGSVGRSVTGVAQHLNVASKGKVGGSVVAFGETIDAFGPIGRGVTALGGTLQLAGPVGGPVFARVGSLSVAPTAQLASSLDYQAKQEAMLPPGTVTGPVTFAPAPEEAPRPAPVLNGLFSLGGLIGLVGSFLVGALAIILMPRAAARAAELGRQQPWQSFGLGLLVLVCVPIVCVLVGLTLIGIPVALCLMALYVFGILLAWPAVGLLIGTQLARLVREDRPLPVLANLAIGLIVLHLVTHVPFIGPLVVVCSVMFGLGMLTQAVRRWQRNSQRPNAAAPTTPYVPALQVSG